jgi:hypothetical protein
MSWPRLNNPNDHQFLSICNLNGFKGCRDMESTDLYCHYEKVMSLTGMIHVSTVYPPDYHDIEAIHYQEITAQQ